MKKQKAKIKKGAVLIEIRSSTYDKEESMFIERMMTQKDFAGMINYIFKYSKEKYAKK